MTDITKYLTPKSTPYYEKVKSTITELYDIIKYPIIIYGGMVRDIIAHYYEYNIDNMVEFIEPNDVDIHISCPSKYKFLDHFSMNHYNNLMHTLSKSKIIEKDMTDYKNINQDNYTLNKYIINGIKFDISANVNHWCIYNDITDYSVNCLTINNNIIEVRGIDMDVDTILGHIEKKELHNVLDMNKLTRYIDYFGKNNITTTKYYEDKILERREKMHSKKYHEI